MLIKSAFHRKNVLFIDYFVEIPYFRKIYKYHKQPKSNENYIYTTMRIVICNLFKFG